MAHIRLRTAVAAVAFAALLQTEVGHTDTATEGLARSPTAVVEEPFGGNTLARQAEAVFGVRDPVTGRIIDPRFLVDRAKNEYQSLAAIGMVTLHSPDGTSTSRATGFLLGDCLAMTAQHATSRDSSHLSVHPDIRFTVASPFAGTSVARATVVASGGYRGTGSDRNRDWALLRLDQPLGRSHGALAIGAIGLEMTLRFGGRLVSAGYPGDKPDDISQLWAQENCRVRFGYTSSVWAHDCAAMPGNSGSPIMARNRSGELFVVAMTTSTSAKELVDIELFDLGVRANTAVGLLEVIKSRAQADSIIRSVSCN